MPPAALCRDFLRNAGHQDAPIEVALQVDSILVALITQARIRWPEFYVPDAVVLSRLANAFVACQLGIDDLPAWLKSMHFSDLYFVCALELDLSGAVASFEQSFVAPAVRSLRARGLDDELKQSVMERLFVAEFGRTAKISTYIGKGPLATWVKVVAARTHIDMRTSLRPLDSEVHFSEESELATNILGSDVEMSILSGGYREPLRSALAAAIADLSVRDRNILRFHFLEGVSGDSLARMYNVSRRTVTRWLEQSRKTVLVKTRSRLAAVLHLDESEVDSLIEVLRSQLQSVIRSALVVKKKSK